MDALDVDTWLHRTGQGVHDAVTRCLHRQNFGGWSENTITSEVLAAIDMAQSINWTGRGFHAGYRVFKASGAHETANGDIAMKVEFSATGAKKIHGTKYFEAKKLYLESGKYAAFDAAQLTRTQDTLGHEVLLYGFRQVSGAGLVGDARCLPTPMAALLKDRGTGALHRAAIPFVTTLQWALLGRGLDWDPARAGAFDAAYALVSKRPSFEVLARIGPPDFVRELDRGLAPEGYKPIIERDPSEGHDTEASNENGRSKGYDFDR